MKMNIDQLFENQEHWDFEQPKKGHEKRFLDKLNQKQTQSKRTYWIPMSIAASLLLVFGILFMNLNTETEPKVAFSPQMQETHDYFSSVIHTELETLKKKENPQNKIIIDDALNELQVLEKDYEKLKTEIIKNGENKQILFALITNMQTRISFIKTVLDQIEAISNLKNNPNENFS